MSKIVVFGANGRVGRLVVTRLLRRGHEVTAFVHAARGMKSKGKLRVIEGDIHDAEAVDTALAGANAAISTLGSWGTPTKDIVATGMKHIIESMERRRIQKVISLTGAEARAANDHLSFIHRAAHIAASVAAGKILRDGEKHIAMLESTELEWTVIRSPVMNESGSARYRLSNRRPYPWQTINRNAVADAMVEMLENEQYVQTSPFINR